MKDQDVGLCLSESVLGGRNVCVSRPKLNFPRFFSGMYFLKVYWGTFSLKTTTPTNSVPRSCTPDLIGMEGAGCDALPPSYHVEKVLAGT